MTLFNFSKYLFIQLTLFIWVLMSTIYFYGAAIIFTLEVMAKYAAIVSVGLIVIGILTAILKSYTKYHYIFIATSTSTVFYALFPHDGNIIDSLIIPSSGFSVAYSLVFFSSYYLTNSRKS